MQDVEQLLAVLGDPSGHDDEFAASCRRPESGEPAGAT
jgi:hypothetical protein